MSTLHEWPDCRFLALPLELRLQIYHHLLSATTHQVTFSSARLEGNAQDIARRLRNDGRSTSTGLPYGQIPRVTSTYDEQLLRITPSTTVSCAAPIRAEEHGRCPFSPIPSILMTNRQIRAEVLQHFPAAKDQPVNVFISYPYGLHVFDNIGSHLQPSVKTVVIAGEYVSNSFDPARAAQRYSRKLMQSTDSSGKHTVAQQDSSEQLARLASNILGLNPQPAELHLRIFYPGRDSYNVVWGDGGSPIVVALESICAAEIRLEVWRDSNATGVYLAARPGKNGKRTVKTVWRQFDDAHNAWEIDPRWSDGQWSKAFERDDDTD